MHLEYIWFCIFHPRNVLLGNVGTLIVGRLRWSHTSRIATREHPKKQFASIFPNVSSGRSSCGMICHNCHTCFHPSFPVHLLCRDLLALTCHWNDDESRHVCWCCICTKTADHRGHICIVSHREDWKHGVSVLLHSAHIWMPLFVHVSQRNAVWVLSDLNRLSHNGHTCSECLCGHLHGVPNEFFDQRICRICYKYTSSLPCELLTREAVSSYCMHKFCDNPCIWRISLCVCKICDVSSHVLICRKGYTCHNEVLVCFHLENFLEVSAFFDVQGTIDEKGDRCHSVQVKTTRINSVFFSFPVRLAHSTLVYDSVQI